MRVCERDGREIFKSKECSRGKGTTRGIAGGVAARRRRSGLRSGLRSEAENEKKMTDTIIQRVEKNRSLIT